MPFRVFTSYCRWLILAVAWTVFGCYGDQTRDANGQRVSTVSIWPDTITLGAGDTVRFRVLYRRGDSLLFDGPAAVWSTSDSAIAGVVNGLVVANRPGSATIVASSNGALGFAHVSVADRNKESAAATDTRNKN